MSRKLRKSQTRWTQRGSYIIIKVEKIKIEHIKNSKGKALLLYKGTPMRLPADFSAETWRPEGSGMMYLSDERKNPTTKKPSNAVIQIWRRDKEFYRKSKSYKNSAPQIDYIRNIKGTSLMAKRKNHN